MDGWITLGAELDTKSFDAQIEDVESKLATLEQRWEETNNMPAFEGKNEDLQNLSLQIEKLSNKLIILKKKQQDVNNQGLENLGNNVSKIGDGMSSILKKVAKWGLALFSVRTAYSLIRNAITTISESNDQMKANIDYMRFALAMSLKPIVEWLVNAVYKLMTYINYISQAWFGYNLFKDAGIEDFEKSLEKSNKTAKDLKKTLMGFDEANVIQDTSSASGGGTTMPSLDLSKVEQIDVPDWVKWIANNKDTIIQLAEIVGIAFGVGKVTSILNNIAKLFGIAGPANAIGGVGLRGLFSSLGLIAIIAGGIIITAMCAKKVWDDLTHLKDEMDEIIEKNKTINRQETDNLDPIEDTNKLYSKMEVHQQSILDNNKNSKNTMAKIFGYSEGYLNASKEAVISSENEVRKLKEMFDVEGRTLSEKEEMLLIAQKQLGVNLRAIGTLEQQGKDTTQLKEVNKQLYSTIAWMEGDIQYTKDQNAKKSKQQWDDLKDKAINSLQKIKDFKIGDKEVGVKVTIGDALKKLGEVISNLGIVQGLKSALETGKNVITTNLVNPIKNAYNSLKSFFTPTYGATGGIINLPGRGVPIGGNIYGGEAGREGLLPLTNPSAMAELGAEIGKWVNISLQNNMVVDGRILATAVNTQANRERLLLNR